MIYVRIPYLSRNGLGDRVLCLRIELPPQRFALDRCDQCPGGWNLQWQNQIQV